MTAFLTLEIRQDERTGGGHDAVGNHLAAIPEVLEAHTITGAGDLMARVVARSNTDLQRVIDLVLADPAIVRSSTVIALATQVPYRVLPLAVSLSSRACTVPRATPSRRDASRTPIRGSVENSSIRLRSSSSIGGSKLDRLHSVSAYCCTFCANPATMTP